MTKRLAWGWLMALVLAACAAHEKAGDQAAALGDWKTAYQAYSAALAKEPENPALKEKYGNAKREAIADAYKKAQACAAGGDWGCALGESEFALELDSGNPEIASFRADAAKNLALSRLSQARQEAEQGKFRFSLELIEKARALSSDPAVIQGIDQARPGLASMADTAAEGLRQRKAYPEAVEALTVAATIDPSKRGKLDALQREYDAWRSAEYERLALEGDQALARRDWAGAEQRYAAALQMRQGGRAEPLASYANGMNLGEQALARKDFAAATAGFRQAVASGQDRGGYAAQQLDRVEVRPYSVRIRSVLARPIRPDGRPWVGRMSPFLTRLVMMFSTGLLDSSSGRASRRIIDAALSIPAENRPTLAVHVTLPDGMRLSTPTQNGLYVGYDSEFVVATNSFDERRLAMHVVHWNGQGFEDVGMVEFPLGEIVRRREANLNGQSVADLRLEIEPAEGARADGMFANMFPFNDGTNTAQDYSMPTPNSAGYRLRSVRASVSAQALAGEPDEGAAEMVVEIVQGGRVVYRSTQLDNLYDGQWTTSNTQLFVQKGEQLRIRIWDMDPTDPDLLVDAPLAAEALSQGSVQVSSPNGSSAMLQFEPRPAWAGGASP
jgi:tetratricopeptide (TPR) repeat protein